MAKIIIEIQDNLYDFWDCRSLEKVQKYNEITEEVDYQLIMNRQSVMANYSAVEFVYESKEARDEDYKRIKDLLKFSEGIVLMDTGEALDALKEKAKKKASRTPTKQPADLFDDELED